MTEEAQQKGRLMFIRASFADTSELVYCLVDLGASVSFINANYAQNLTRMLDFEERFVVGVHGKEEATKGLGLATLIITMGQSLTGSFHIHPSLPLQLILGMDLLRKYFAKVDLEANRLIPYVGRPIETCEAPTRAFPGMILKDGTNRVDSIWTEICATIDETVSEKFRQGLYEIINRFEKAFHLEGDRLNPCKHTVPKLEFTEHNFMVRSKGYRYSEGERMFLKETIEDWVAQGICKPTSSEFSSPCVIVSKGHKQGLLVKPRLCIDYRALNNFVKECRWPIANAEYLLSRLEGTSYYAQIDLAKGFMQCKVREEDQKYLAFIAPTGLYTFTRTPFGLKTSANAFMYCLDSTLNGVKNTLIYMDDCVAYGKSEEECLEAFNGLMKALHQDGWQVAVKKCVLGARKIKVLGHIISEAGVEVDPEKVRSITEFKQPENVSQVRSFLGICSYYRKYIFLFSKLAKPLTSLLQKGAIFDWGQSQREAFESLKNVLVTAPILRHFSPNLPTVVHCDSSDIGCGGVLMQLEQGKERIVAFCSRSFSIQEQRLAIIEREFLGLLFCLERFRCYIYLRPFRVICDSDPLKSMKYATDKNPKLLRWAMRLREFNYEMVFRPSSANKVADGLSRIVPRVNKEEGVGIVMPMDMEAELPSIHAFAGLPTVNWETVQMQDKQCGQLKEKLKLKPSMPFMVEGNVLYYTGKIGKKVVVPKNLRPKVLNLFHDHVLAGHMGVRGTMAKIREKLWWPAMKADVTRYIKTCDSCQRAKRPVRKQPGLLRPIVPPGEPGKYLAWDITGPLPLTSSSNCYIIMSICLLSKFVIARPIPDGSAESVVKFFLENILAVFGSPQYILSDCGASFLAKKTQAVLESVGCKSLKTSAYAPTTNGIIEKQFYLLKQCLRIYLMDCAQNKWDHYLSYLIFAMNTTEKPSTKFTPYEIVFIKKPPRPITAEFDNTKQTVSPWTEAQEIRTRALESIKRAQAAYKERADRTRMDVEFQEGDLVLVFNPATKEGLNRKLTVHWSGPWIVIKMMSTNTVLISPLSDPQVHKVINVRRVKRYYTRVEQDKIQGGEGEDERNQNPLDIDSDSYESASEYASAEDNTDTEESKVQETREEELTFSEYQSSSNTKMSEPSDTTSNSPEEQASLFRSRYGRTIRPVDRYQAQ